MRWKYSFKVFIHSKKLANYSFNKFIHSKKSEIIHSMKIFIQLKNVVVEHPYQQSKTQKYEKQHGQPTPGFFRESLYCFNFLSRLHPRRRCPITPLSPNLQVIGIIFVPFESKWRFMNCDTQRNRNISRSKTWEISKSLNYWFSV